MIRKSTLILATTFAAGLLFVNVYNSLIDAANWGSNIPESIQTARAYFKVAHPGYFFRIGSPINQLFTLLALITCWKMGKKMRLYCALALLFAVSVDVLTFAYFYPRLDIMFNNPDISDVNAVKTAWSEWAFMNWPRSGLEVVNLIFDFAALTLLFKTENSSIKG